MLSVLRRRVASLCTASLAASGVTGPELDHLITSFPSPWAGLGWPGSVRDAKGWTAIFISIDVIGVNARGGDVIGSMAAAASDRPQLPRVAGLSAFVTLQSRARPVRDLRTRARWMA